MLHLFGCPLYLLDPVHVDETEQGTPALGGLIGQGQLLLRVADRHDWLRQGCPVVAHILVVFTAGAYAAKVPTHLLRLLVMMQHPARYDMVAGLLAAHVL